MSSQFQAIVEAAADLIRESVQIPSDVAVVAYQRGEVESEIERAMATLGAAVVVLPFETVHADEAELIVHILENPTLNATGVDGQALRDAVVLALAGDDLDGRLAAHLSEHRIIRADAEDLTIREITWKTAVQMQA
jgi:hypothetical protein